MSGFGTLVSAEDALNIILEKLRPVTASEIVGLEAADRRVAAEDLKSTLDVPAFERSAMDGFAVIAEDLEEPVMLREIGKAFAGKPFTRTVKRGECVEIATGAPLPKGTDAVVMVENAQRIGETISFRQPVAPGENVIQRAADIGKGDVVVRRGALLGPGQIAAIAIVGKAKVKVYRRPEVLVFTTGDEVVPPGQKLGKGKVYDCNSYALRAVIERSGGNVTWRQNVKDTATALKQALKQASKKYDAVVFSGGTSVGSHDFGAEALKELGKIHVHGVAIKPGKPLLFGTIGKMAVFGMPGHPTSCLLTAKLFLAPAIRRLGHNEDGERLRRTVTLGHEIKQDKTKQLILPVRLDLDDTVHSTFKGSSAISSLSESVGYIEVEPGDGLLPKGAETVVNLIR